MLLLQSAQYNSMLLLQSAQYNSMLLLQSAQYNSMLLLNSTQFDLVYIHYKPLFLVEAAPVPEFKHLEVVEGLNLRTQRSVL